MPTALEKTGDFSDFVDGSTGALIPIYDPAGSQLRRSLTGQQIPGNVIPASCISATSATYIPDIPDPDRPGSGIGGLDSNKSFAPFINPHIQHVWGFTVDQNLTPTQSLHCGQWRNTFSNYSFDNSPLVIAPNPLNSQKFEPAKGTVFLLNYNNAISPHLVMTAGVGWIGEINNQFNSNEVRLPGHRARRDPALHRVGRPAQPDQVGHARLLVAVDQPQARYCPGEQLALDEGPNTFNIGVDFRRSYQDDNEDQTEGGQFSFSQRTTSVPNSNDPNFGKYGSAFASFLFGIPDQANRANNIEARLRNWLIAPYVQDDIKLSPRLTVNLGLRWDIQAPFTENDNNIVFFDPNKPGTLPGRNIPGSATKFGSCTGCAGYYPRRYSLWPLRAAARLCVPTDAKRWLFRADSPLPSWMAAPMSTAPARLR